MPLSHIILREVITYTRGSSRKGCKALGVSASTLGGHFLSAWIDRMRVLLSGWGWNPAKSDVFLPQHAVSSAVLPRHGGFTSPYILSPYDAERAWKEGCSHCVENYLAGPYTYGLWWEECLSRLGHTIHTVPDSSSTQEQELTGS